MATLVTPDYVSNVLFGDVDSHDNDSITLFTDIAEELVLEYCKQDLTPRTAFVAPYSSIGQTILPLHTLLRTLTKVERNDGTLDIPNWTDITKYVVAQPALPTKQDGSGNYLYSWVAMADGSCFIKGKNNYRLTGNWGIVTAPNTLKYAIALTVKHLMDAREYSDLIRMETSSARTVILNNDNTGVIVSQLPAIAKAAITRFTKKVI